MSALLSPSLSIVIPCFNEEAAITSVLSKLMMVTSSEQFQVLFSSSEIIVIDDFSTDRTPEILSRVKGVSIFRNDRNLGYGGSLKRGFAAARGDFIAFLDMDYSYDPDDLCDLFFEMKRQGAEMVFGNRLNRKNGMPFIRGIGNYFFSVLVRVLFQQKVTDVCTGFRIFKKNLIPLALEIKSNDLSYSIDLTLKVLLQKKTVTQMPIRYHDRLGSSKLSVIKDGFGFLAIVLSHFFKSRLASK